MQVKSATLLPLDEGVSEVDFDLLSDKVAGNWQSTNN